MARALHEASRNPKRQISVVLPIYNERENIRPLIDEITDVLQAAQIDFEIVAVDDGSTDGSAEALIETLKENSHLKVIEFRRNAGQSAAFDAGFRYATGDVVVLMDSDRQNDPHDIPMMLNKLNEGFDVVVGWRKNRQDGFLIRKVPSRIANWLIRRVTKTKVKDLGCSLKMFRKEIASDLRVYGEMHRFIAVLAEDAGARVAELVVNHRARIAGESKYNLSRTFKVILDLMTVWFMTRYKTRPIYVFGSFGFGLLSVGTLLCGVVLFQKFFADVWVHRNPLAIIAFLAFVLGIQSISLGLISEWLIRTYYEASGQSPYRVRHVHTHQET